MIICAYEDRRSHLIGLKLLVASLARHVPHVPVVVTCPSMDEELRVWMARFPQVTIDESSDLRGQGWDVKPTLLLRLLDSGHDEVVWLDTDILVTGDFRPLLAGGDTIAVAEDDYWNGPRENKLRTQGWNLAVGRTLDRLANGGFIRDASASTVAVGMEKGPRHTRIPTG